MNDLGTTSIKVTGWTYALEQCTLGSRGALLQEKLIFLLAFLPVLWPSRLENNPISLEEVSQFRPGTEKK